MAPRSTGRPAAKNTSARLSATDSASLRNSFCGRKPRQRARQRSRGAPASACTACPATTTSPDEGVSKPATSASQVDLPLPEGPRSNSVPPCGTATSGKRRTGACG